MLDNPPGKSLIGKCDIPAIILISLLMDFLDVNLYDTTSRTIQANGDVITKKVKANLVEWKVGGRMRITSKGLAANTWESCRIWFRCFTIPPPNGLQSTRT